MSLFERQYDERISGLSFRNLSDDVASDAQSSPDIILDTLSLALSAIDNKMNLVVSTPSRERFGRVLAALLAIDAQLKEDETARFTKAATPDSDFAIGDKSPHTAHFDSRTIASAAENRLKSQTLSLKEVS